MNRISFTSRQGACLSRIGRAGLAAGAFFLLVGSTMPSALAEDGGGITPPNPPAPIAVPSGNSPFLMGHAIGTQGYLCLPFGSGASWTVDASRPQATLFVTLGTFSQQILTHFLSPDANPTTSAPNPLPFGSPTWESSLDSSEVWGNKIGSISAGSDPTCPNNSSIPCLLLQAIGSVPGPNGFGIMTKTTYIQRLNTNGGIAPSTGCALPTDVGSQVLVPYTADYYFYQATTKD
jgi:hypothetical protein